MSEDTLSCVTLDTGIARRAARHETPAALQPLMRDVLRRAFAQDAAVLAEPYNVQLTAVRETDCLLVTVWDTEAEVGRSAPVATLGIAAGEPAAEFWHLLHAGAVQPPLTRADRMPPLPWCAVRHEQGLPARTDALDWLDDLARALAWTWIETPKLR